MKPVTNSPFALLLSHVPHSPPRSTRDLGGLAIFKIQVLGLLAFPVVFTLFATAAVPFIYQAREIQAQVRTFKTIQGTVIKSSLTNKSAAQSGVPGETIVPYAFRLANGMVYYGSESVGGASPFAGVQSGTKVPILYDPADPGFSGLAGEINKNKFVWQIIFLIPVGIFLFTSTLMGFNLFEPLKGVGKARKIYKNGSPTAGKIRYISRRPNFNTQNSGPIIYDVSYEFRVQDQTVRGKQPCSNDWLVNQLTAGSEITVAYLPQKPADSIFLEAFIE